MSDVTYQGQQDIFKEASEKGFFVLKNFFKRESIVKVREELVKILDEDLEYRKLHQLTVADLNYKQMEHQNSRLDGSSSLTHHMHTYLFPAFQCELFASLVEQMFAHEVIHNFIEKAIGPNSRLRVDLFRRASGIDDYCDEFELPHRWHRDTVGEFTFGFYLDDMDIPQSGCTAVVPGTHRSSYSPLWNLVFSPKNNYTSYEDFVNNNMNYTYFPQMFVPLALFNRKLRKKLSNHFVELSGRMGDIFFFFNDTWHGRAPNRTGKKFMLCRIGGFASGFKFKDDLPLPKPINVLPPLLAEYYSTKPQGATSYALIHQFSERRRDNLLTKAAFHEKRVFNNLKKFMNL